jgi:hypothetical protein
MSPFTPTVRLVSKVSNLDLQKRHHMYAKPPPWVWRPSAVASLISESMSERNNAILLPQAVLHRLGLHRNPNDLLEADFNLNMIWERPCQKLIDTVSSPV